MSPKTEGQTKPESKQPQHVRVYFGAHGINVKESANPAFKTTDGDFIRRAMAANESRKLTEVGNGSELERINKNFESIKKNFKITKENFANIDEFVKDLDKRLVEIEQFMNDVVRPSHRKLPPETDAEKGKDGVKVMESKEERVEIPKDPEMVERLKEMENRARERRKSRTW